MDGALFWAYFITTALIVYDNRNLWVILPGI